MGGDHVAGRGSRTRVVSLGQHLVVNALGQSHHTIFLGLLHQPILIGLRVCRFVLLYVDCDISYFARTIQIML